MIDGLDRFFGKDAELQPRKPAKKKKASKKRILELIGDAAVEADPENWELPTSLFYRLGKQGCLFVVGEQTYLPDYSSSDNFFQFGDRKFGLTEAESVVGMVDLYRVLEQKTVTEWGDAYVDQIISREGQAGDLEEELKNNEVLNFIVNKVFKHYQGADSAHLGDLVGDYIEEDEAFSDELDKDALEIIDSYISKLVGKLGGDDEGDEIRMIQA